MDNLSVGIVHAYKICFMQVIEIMISVRNYSKIIEHIETGISDKSLNEYCQKLKKLNKIVELSPSFYKNINKNLLKNQNR